MKKMYLIPVLALVGCVSVKEPAYDTLISHRGESKDAPENTMAAFKTAVERGFGFECDVYLSKDKELFTFHDRDLSRTTGGVHKERCTEASWKDTLSKVNVGGWGRWKGSKFDPSRPALLSEVLALARDGRYIYVEIKDDNPSWAPYIRAEIEKAKNVNPGNVLFITFGEDIASALKREMPVLWSSRSGFSATLTAASASDAKRMRPQLEHVTRCCARRTCWLCAIGTCIPQTEQHPLDIAAMTMWLFL